MRVNSTMLVVALMAVCNACGVEQKREKIIMSSLPKDTVYAIYGVHSGKQGVFLVRSSPEQAEKYARLMQVQKRLTQLQNEQTVLFNPRDSILVYSLKKLLLRPSGWGGVIALAALSREKNALLAALKPVLQNPEAFGLRGQLHWCPEHFVSYMEAYQLQKDGIYLKECLNLQEPHFYKPRA